MRRKRALKAAKKAGKSAARKAWKTRRRNAGAKKLEHKFRPALAADGAILFMNADAGDFEIPRTEARGLVNLVRKLTGPELAVAVGFIERLDKGEVGA